MWYDQRRWYVQSMVWSSIQCLFSIGFSDEQTQVMKIPPVPFLSHVDMLDKFQYLTAVVNRLAGHISDAGYDQEP